MPFKHVFTGADVRPYKRATSSQKCLRAGGKHNDLENVGYTRRHHTFFEMLGNFSFGDYFKERAIELAWNLITKEFGLKPDRLCVTVFSEDDEAAAHWKKLTGFPDHKIIRIPTSDNFWAMGDTGPCGPCSEIFFDHGEHIPGGPPGSPDQDGDRFIEIWNLVFMQFEQVTREERVSLPKPSIDTGMGLERIAAVLQGKHNNYDIDLFRSIIEAVAHETGVDPDGPQAASHKVIADHLRTTAFLIADGVLPSNEGRGYVLRRIMRRAMRHAHLLGAKQPLMHRLVPALVTEMGQAYPELVRAQPLIEATLLQEETRFRRTLANGLRLLLVDPVARGRGHRLGNLAECLAFVRTLGTGDAAAEGGEVDFHGAGEAHAHFHGRGEDAAAHPVDHAVDGEAGVGDGDVVAALGLQRHLVAHARSEEMGPRAGGDEDRIRRELGMARDGAESATA